MKLLAEIFKPELNAKFWIKPDGEVVVLPPQTHHQEYVEHVGILWHRAFKQGWVRAFYEPDGTMNYNYREDIVGPAAIKAMLRLGNEWNATSFKLESAFDSSQLGGDDLDRRQFAQYLRGAIRNRVTEGVRLNERLVKITDDLRVHEKPSLAEIKTLLSKSKRNLLRGIAVRHIGTEQWTIYFWDGYDMDHNTFLHVATKSGLRITDDIGIFISTDEETAFYSGVGLVGHMKLDDLYASYYPDSYSSKQILMQKFPRIFGNALVEAWDRTIKPPYANGLEVDIFKNPDRAEYAKLIREHKQLRGILDDQGNLLVWDAYLATHGDIDVFYDSVGAYLYLTPDRLWFNDMNFYHSGLKDGPLYSKTVRIMYERAKKNRSLNRIYGRDFVPLGIDNETRQRFDITPEWIEKHVEQ